MRPDSRGWAMTAAKLSTLGLAGAALLAGPALAQDAPAADATVNTGDTAWMLTSTALVLMMTIPGLALFYAGMVRKKNILGTMMQSFAIVAIATIVWMVVGYSLAFGEGGAYVGDLSKLFLRGVAENWDKPFTLGTGDSAVAFTIPETVFLMFQMTFAIITPALITGAFAERMKFSAMVLFTILWLVVVYSPIAHWVWHPNGWIFGLGALDFAGGTVVHINAGIAGLVGAYVIGKRVGYGREAMQPHNLPMTMIGASLLWVGWFGFNAGSSLMSNEQATLAFFNTMIATAAAVLAWVFTEWAIKGKPSMLGAASGAVAGLVGITPAAGLVGMVGAFVIGIAAGVICVWGVNGLKRILKADDALDVFGVHGVGGIIGALLTGVFNAQALGGPGLKTAAEIGGQVWVQLEGVLLTIVWSGVVAWIAYKIADMVCGLRVPEDVEREGLDITCHGESAYHS